MVPDNGDMPADRTSTLPTDRQGLPERQIHRRVAALLILIAASLAVASIVHLAGHVQGRSDLFDADDAGIAEAVIGAVLAAGALVMLRAPGRARSAGLAATAFAVAGFLVGLGITARGGHLPDIAYHLVVLPLLIGGFIVLAREPRRSTGRRQ